MMGVGKTTVGRRVAAKLKRSFADVDEELEGRSGRTIGAWFADDGEDAFRAAEADVLRSLLDRPAPSVIAGGGGVVCLDGNRERLAAQDALVVWLRADPAFLLHRARQRPARPLLAVDDPLAVLTDLARQRQPWYEQVADITVDVEPVYRSEEKPKRTLAELVLERLAPYGILVP